MALPQYMPLEQFNALIRSARDCDLITDKYEPFREQCLRPQRESDQVTITPFTRKPPTGAGYPWTEIGNAWEFTGNWRAVTCSHSGPLIPGEYIDVRIGSTKVKAKIIADPSARLTQK